MTLDALATGVRAKRVILFAGAGVSQNLGLPSFHELIRHLATKLEYDPDIFETHGDNLALTEYYHLEGPH